MFVVDYDDFMTSISKHHAVRKNINNFLGEEGLFSIRFLGWMCARK